MTGILLQFGSGVIPANCNAWRLTNYVYNSQNLLPMYDLPILMKDIQSVACFNTHSPVLNLYLPIHCQIHNIPLL